MLIGIGRIYLEGFFPQVPEDLVGRNKVLGVILVYHDPLDKVFGIVGLKTYGIDIYIISEPALEPFPVFLQKRYEFKEHRVLLLVGHIHIDILDAVPHTASRYGDAVPVKDVAAFGVDIALGGYAAFGLLHIVSPIDQLNGGKIIDNNGRDGQYYHSQHYVTIKAFVFLFLVTHDANRFLFLSSVSSILYTLPTGLKRGNISILFNTASGSTTVEKINGIYLYPRKRKMMSI